MTRVLFTGITGLLGRYFLTEKLPDYEVVGTYKSNSAYPNFVQLDVTNKKSVSDLIRKSKPKIVIHAASLGSVDYCETHKDEALKVNVEGTENIVSACEDIGSSLIFISSNAVFNGEDSPYKEDSAVDPLDFYGKTKVQGENIVKSSKIDNVIVRLMTMYGWNNPNERLNPVTWIIQELREGKKVNVVTDIYNNHLYGAQSAKALWKIVEKNKFKGVFNIAGKDCINRYELALKVAEIFNLNSDLINPVKNDFFKNIAPRPMNTCFETAKMEEELSIAPLGVSEGLKRMRGEIHG